MSIQLDIDDTRAVTLSQVEILFPFSRASSAIKEMRQTLTQLAEDIKARHADQEGYWPASETEAYTEYQKLIELANR